jgi:hypothetical protein
MVWLRKVQVFTDLGFLLYASHMMCKTCGDLLRFTEWIQLSLDDSHSVWFCGVECLCGYKIFEAFAVEGALDEA